MTGVTLGHVTGAAWLDGAASIMIGALLMTVAVLLARESRGLLVGEAVDPRTLDDVRRIASSDAAVERVLRVLTAHFGPRTVLLNLDIQFRAGLSAADVVSAVGRIEESLRGAHPELEYIFVEGRRLRQAAS